jgi:dipeptidyl aminopeptidase/acylaminoacyl peptidase
MTRSLALAFGLSLLTQSISAQVVTERTANDGNVVLSGIPEIPEAISARLSPYQNVRAAALADWSHDGSSLFIVTRFASVPQLHRVDMPGGARHQVTFFNEPFQGGLRRPGGTDILFAMDEGGGEFNQLYLLDPATGRATRLTDGRSRNTNAVWSPDGTRIAFTSTRRDGRSNDVWVMEVADTAGARVVHQAAGGTFWIPSDWSPDGQRLLLLNYVSIADSRIHLLDLASGEATLIAGGPDALGSYVGIDPHFDRSGRHVFFATDAEGEFLTLMRMDLRTRSRQRIGASVEWDVEAFAASDDRRLGAYVVNEGGISRIYLLDPETLATSQVEGVPIGVVSGLRFSPDARRLAVTMQTSTSPSDVFTLDLDGARAVGGPLTRWTFSEVGGLDPSEFVDAELIQYRSFDGLEVPAFVYRPREAGPHPVVVLIHGGPESQSRPTFSSIIQSWVGELGVAVVVPNVRGSSGYGKTYLSLDNAMLREHSVRDIGALLDWIETTPDLDPGRVMVYGGSYGGYMVLASLVHYSHRLRGGVDIVGISDFITFLENTEAYRRDLRRAEYGDERDPQMRAFFEQISPKRRAAEIAAPLFVIQGQNDPRVPYTEAEQIVSEVRANGRPVWYMNALNEGHGFARRENQDLMRDAVVLFFEEFLLPER